MNKVYLLIVLLWIQNNINAQYDYIATQAGLSQLQGTARFVATGGILGSVGSDFSNISTNPAGLAMFSRTELSVTPSFQINNVYTNFMDIRPNQISYANSDLTNVRFVLNNVGLVVANRKSDDNVLRSSNISLGFNRTANFNRSISFGANDNNFYSYSNALAAELDYAYTLNPSGFPKNTSPTIDDYYNYNSRAMMAYEGALLFFDGDTIKDPVIGKVDQYGTKKVTGGINELSFAWSGNILDKGYFGIALGIPMLSYESQFLYSEEDKGFTNMERPFIGKFVRYDLSETVKYKGSGLNLKFGGLYKLTDNLKISGYIHTPTYYQLTESYGVGISSEYQNSTNPYREQKFDDYDFVVVTPFKTGGGLSYLFGRSGFIGAEYEFSNLKGTSFDFNDTRTNSYFKDIFRNERHNTHTFKLGGEFALDAFRIRAGINYRTSPYTSNIIAQGGSLESYTYTAGLGYRGDNFSIDLAYMKNQFKEYNTFYNYGANEVGISTWNSTNQVMATFNFRFNRKG